MRDEEKLKREILPADEMQRKYGLYAETWEVLDLDPVQVPETLRGLLSWASRFGIGDDIIRADTINKLPLKLAQDLVVAVSPFLDVIRSWAGRPNSGELNDEMAAYMALYLLCDDVRQSLSLSPVMSAAIARKEADLRGTRAIHRAAAVDDVNRALDSISKSSKDAFDEQQIVERMKPLAGALKGDERLASSWVRPRAVVEEFVSRFNATDVEGLAALYHEDAVNHQVANDPVVGRASIREMFAKEFAMAKMVCVVEQILEDEPWAILEWKDPLGLRGCGFFLVEDGLIRLQRGYWDKLSFLRVHGLPIEQDEK